MSYRPMAEPRRDRRTVTTDEYIQYHRDGFLVARGLVPLNDVEELKGHAMDLLEGRFILPGMDHLHTNASANDKIKRFDRIHMIHTQDPMMERFMLHPRVLDLLEALIGPDVLALQTMQFYNPPGRGGQGWHQDSYYITTYPDTLIGTWLALDTVDEENGCLWVAPGSRAEPIYPSPNPNEGFVHSDGAFADLNAVRAVSNMDDAENQLTPVARKYEALPVPVEPGDVIFFHGHLLHRSFPNKSRDRWRRAFVSHYCNARSWVPWNHGMPYEGEAANYLHILARGQTQLPHARRRFGMEDRGQRTEDAKRMKDEG